MEYDRNILTTGTVESAFIMIENRNPAFPNKRPSCKRFYPYYYCLLLAIPLRISIVVHHGYLYTHNRLSYSPSIHPLILALCLHIHKDL